MTMQYFEKIGSQTLLCENITSDDLDDIVCSNMSAASTTIGSWSNSTSGNFSNNTLYDQEVYVVENSLLVQQILYVVVGAAGLSSNILSLIAILRKGTLRRRPEMQIIVSLTLACCVNAFGFFSAGIRRLIYLMGPPVETTPLGCMCTVDLTPMLIGRQCEPLLNLMVSVDRLISVEYSKLYSTISHRRRYLILTAFFPWLLTLSSVIGGWCMAALGIPQTPIDGLCDDFEEIFSYGYATYHNAIEATFTFAAIIVYVLVLLLYERQKRRSLHRVTPQRTTTPVQVRPATPLKNRRDSKMVGMVSRLSNKIQVAIEEPPNTLKTNLSDSHDELPNLPASSSKRAPAPIQVQPERTSTRKIPKVLSKFAKMEENVQKIQQRQQNKLTIMLGLVGLSTFLFEAVPYGMVEITPAFEPFWLICVAFNVFLNGVILLWRNDEIHQSVIQFGAKLHICRASAEDAFIASS